METSRSVPVEAGVASPLQLLDLTHDVLQAIVKEVTHTNDLCALALTHSVLHFLVIPHIYARFDIVWPDSDAIQGPRGGVDALTYGLTTFVMTNDVFGEQPSINDAKLAPHSRHDRDSSECNGGVVTSWRPPHIRRGNNFAKHTRKFTIGNGPDDFVQEYAITRECGRMLGTLIALAIARMQNLESFHLDMPSGLPREAFLALASLADRQRAQKCKLERVWIRWHDNSDQDSSNPITSRPDVPSLILHPGRSSTCVLAPNIGRPQDFFNIPAYPRVEFPTFSVLPSLKSITVLNIDEKPYVEELSLLVERSLEILHELRVGVAERIMLQAWLHHCSLNNEHVSGNESPDQHVSTSQGILGILLNRFCDYEEKLDTGGHPFLSPQPAHNQPLGSGEPLSPEACTSDLLHPAVPADVASPYINNTSLLQVEDTVDALTQSLQQKTLNDAQKNQPHALAGKSEKNDTVPTKPVQCLEERFSAIRSRKSTPMLRLEILELERVPISVPVLSRAIDWSRLTNLTLLNCFEADKLWKALRKQFTPVKQQHTSTTSLGAPSQVEPDSGHHTKGGRSDDSNRLNIFTLKLQHLHVDAVSPSLLVFIHTTLACDSLKTLFLQCTPYYKLQVTVDQINRTVLRRQRSSLTRFLLDSTHHESGQGSPPDITLQPGLPLMPDAVPTHSQHWPLTRETIDTMLSPRSRLRELSISLDWKDWHYFLQRLTLCPGLRSLHITSIQNHRGLQDVDIAVSRTSQHDTMPQFLDDNQSIQPGHQGVVEAVRSRIALIAKECALEILNIVHLKPELELCYVAVLNDCFEIVEEDQDRKKKEKNELTASNGSDLPDWPIVDETQNITPSLPPAFSLDYDDDDDDDEDTSDPHDEAASTDSEAEMMTGNLMSGDLPSDDEQSDAATGDLKNPKRIRFKLRKILFYEDKVSIFKARHGRL